MRVAGLGIVVDDVTEGEALERVRSFLRDSQPHYVVTPNSEMVVLAKSDARFRQSLQHSDLALVDGIGVFLAFRFLGYRLRQRLPGTDFLEALLREFSSGTRFFFLGGERGVAMAAAEVARQRFGATVVGVEEPPRDLYQRTGEPRPSKPALHQSLVGRLRATRPDVLVVALGHGLQEKWIAAYITACPSVRVALGVGGALDYLSGRVARAPKALRRLGLEWLWRLSQEPWRWRRIWTAAILFSWETLRWLVAMRMKYRESVVGCILNRRGDVLLVERSGSPGHWQFPQGGRELHETQRQAVVREMREEVGAESLEVIGQSAPGVHRYAWKKTLGKRGQVVSRKYGYKGQQQTVFYLRFMGDESELRVDNVEHTAWQWVPKEQLLLTIHPVRRPLARIILQDLHRLKL